MIQSWASMNSLSRRPVPQEDLPAKVDVGAGHAGLGGPQPDRQWVSAARQVVDLEADQCAFDNGSSPSWPIPAERVVSRGWIRSQAMACTVLQRSVTCVVATSGSPQVPGLAKRNSLHA